MTKEFHSSHKGLVFFTCVIVNLAICLIIYKNVVNNIVYVPLKTTLNNLSNDNMTATNTSLKLHALIRYYEHRTFSLETELEKYKRLYFETNKIKTSRNVTPKGSTGIPIEVNNWGKSYLPLRVWCCLKTKYNIKILLIIQETWGKYCDNLLFFVGDDQQEYVEESKLRLNKNHTLNNVIKLKLSNTGEGKPKNVWEKTWKLQKYMYDNHIDDFDWLIQADSDAWFSTYNFKLYAQYFDPNFPWYMGDTLLHSWRRRNVVFNAGGIYGLSKGAVIKLGKIYSTKEFLYSDLNQSINSHNLCNNHISWDDDVLMGVCLKSVGVFPLNVLDSDYRTKWSLLRSDYIANWGNWWYFEDKFSKVKAGRNCLSQHMIAFHGYKNNLTLRKKFSYLDRLYNDKRIEYEYKLAVPPPKPTTFLYNNSWTDFDQYFNIKDPPEHQKLWKGVDNLWDYSDVYQGF